MVTSFKLITGVSLRTLAGKHNDSFLLVIGWCLKILNSVFFVDPANSLVARMTMSNCLQTRQPQKKACEFKKTSH
jgi:hypothetical protein